MRFKSFTPIVVIGILLATNSALDVRPATAANEVYTITDVGSIVGSGKGQFDVLGNVNPSTLTESGLVVANAYPSTELVWSVPFTSADGQTKRFGREKSFSVAYGINEAGIVVGEMTSRDDLELTRLRPVVWTGSEVTTLPALGGEVGSARSINDAGLIVGYSALETESGSVLHATYWEDGVAVDLGTLGGDNSIANDINESGVIVGAAVRTAVRYRPAVWQGGELNELPLPDFWVAGEALAINDNGVIVGGGFREFAESPIRWVNGAHEELPGFEERATGVARDVNTNGIAVGNLYLQSSAYDGNVAVRWDDTGVVNLNDLIPENSGYVLTGAIAINDGGQILATALKDGLQHGVVLTPGGSSLGIEFRGFPVMAAAFRDSRPEFSC